MKNYNTLKEKTELFTDAFYATTLPAEVVEAFAANLTILKSPTIFRQYDGRMWNWEGCGNEYGLAMVLVHMFGIMLKLYLICFLKWKEH